MSEIFLYISYFHRIKYLLLRQKSEEAEWLVVKLTKERLKKLENNEMDTYTAFTKPEYGCLYLMIGDPKSIEMKLILPEQLSDEMLPYPGEYLDCRETKEYQR